MVDNPTKIYNDYVRANLPNSMSYDTGTDRYDINSHSFFKFKNSNWYFNYISKYGYSAFSAYAVNGFEPALVFDFKGNYFRKSATDSTFGASITHAATTNATMVDSDGLLKWRPHNNLTKSNTFSTWNRNLVVAVDNAATGPNGVANTASVVTFSSTGSYFYNLSTVAVSVGNKVTLAAWVRSDTITSITFTINGRTSSANNTLETNLAVTPTWTLVSFEATVIGNDTGLYFIIGKVNPASPASQIGDFEIYGAHMFRSDLGGMVNDPDRGDSYVPTTTTPVYLSRRGHHIYNGSAWVNEGILHESEARTNVCTYSNDFGNVAYLKWLPSNITVTPNSAISPDGTTNATKFDMASNGYTRKITSQVPTVGQTYTFSVWLKAGTASEVNTVLLFSGGGLGYTSVTQTLTNEWQRFTITSTLASGTPDQVRARFVATQAGTIFVYGAQIEEGATPSSYIPTGSSTVTRAAETLTVPAANLPYPTTPVVIGPELVTNGADPITATTGWVVRANGTLSTSGGDLIITTPAAGVSRVYQGIPVTIGSVYTISWDITLSGSGRTVTLGTSVGGNQILSSTSLSASHTFVATTTTVYFEIGCATASINETYSLSLASVKEINPLALSIQIDGKMTYADSDNINEVQPYYWLLNGPNYIYARVSTVGTRSGQPTFLQRETTSGNDFVNGIPNAYTPDTNVPFNLASRHGSTFINGAHEGTLLTVNTTPTILPDLSSTDLDLGFDFMGTIGEFRMWSDDLGDVGITEATLPSTEPSLSLTFDGSENSFIVLDWSE